MLTVLAFRQVFFSKKPGCVEKLRRYLYLLNQNYHLTLPGSPAKKHSVMLTFDYASVDFYTHIFPFLKQHQIPAVVGIAWRYVADDDAVSLPLHHRLAPSETLAFQDEVFAKHHPFCSKQELLELAATPHIQLASSGFAVRNLRNSPPYLDTEIFLSKHMIEKYLNISPQSFLYPFGKYDHTSEKLVRKHYRFSFVLNNTINTNAKRYGIHRLDMTKASSYTLPRYVMSPYYGKNWVIDRCRQAYLQLKTRYLLSR